MGYCRCFPDFVTIVVAYCSRFLVRCSSFKGNRVIPNGKLLMVVHNTSVSLFSDFLHHLIRISSDFSWLQQLLFLHQLWWLLSLFLSGIWGWLFLIFSIFVFSLLDLFLQYAYSLSYLWHSILVLQSFSLFAILAWSSVVKLLSFKRSVQCSFVALEVFHLDCFHVSVMSVVVLSLRFFAYHGIYLVL